MPNQTLQYEDSGNPLFEAPDIKVHRTHLHREYRYLFYAYSGYFRFITNGNATAATQLAKRFAAPATIPVPVKYPMIIDTPKLLTKLVSGLANSFRTNLLVRFPGRSINGDINIIIR